MSETVRVIISPQFCGVSVALIRLVFTSQWVINRLAGPRRGLWQMLILKRSWRGRGEEDFNTISSRRGIHLCSLSSAPPSCSLLYHIPSSSLRPHAASPSSCHPATTAWHDLDPNPGHLYWSLTPLHKRPAPPPPTAHPPLLPLIARSPLQLTPSVFHLSNESRPHISPALVWGFWWWCPLVKGCEETLGAHQIDREPRGSCFSRGTGRGEEKYLENET